MTHWNIGRRCGQRRKPLYGIGLLVFGGLGWLLLWLKFPNDMVDPIALFLAATLAHTALKCWLAAEACRQFSEDRRSGGFELLLSTPLPVREILRGQTLALNRQFFPAVTAVLVMDALMFTVKARDRFVSSSGEWALSFFAIVVMFVADLYTLGWLGMWLGLVSKTAHRAASAALVRVLVLPWVFFFLGLTAIAFISPSPGQTVQSTGFLVGTWLLLGLGMNSYYLNSARQNLLQHFRSAVAQQFTGGKFAGPRDAVSRNGSPTVAV